MKRMRFAAITLLVFSAVNVFPSVHIRYHNLDKKDVILKFIIDGEVREITFKAGKKSTVTVKGKADTCTAVTSCEETEVSDEQEIEIINGCIKKLRSK